MVGCRQPLLCLGQTVPEGKAPWGGTQAQGESAISWRQIMELPDILSLFLIYYASSLWCLNCVTFDQGKSAWIAHTWAKVVKGMHPSTPHPAYLVLATVTGRLLRQRFLSWVPWTPSQRWGGSFNFACMCPWLQVHTCIFPGSGVLGLHYTLWAIYNPEQMPHCKGDVHCWIMAGWSGSLPLQVWLVGQ